MLNVDKFVVWRKSDNQPLPDVSFVSPMIRRRMTDLQKIVVGLAHQIAPVNQNYSVVFASQFGEWQQTLKLIEQLNSENEMSPAGFSNSVHNAAVGILSIITGNKLPYTSVAAGKRTLEFGILSALMNSGPTLFIFAEEQSPEAYIPYTDGIVPAFGMALLLSDTGSIKCRLQSSERKPLTFDEMALFLEQGPRLTTSCWEMEK